MDSFTLPSNIPESLSRVITQLISRVEAVESENTLLKSENAALVKKVASLEEELLLAKNGKKSTTSSTPPSADLARSNTKNSRVKSGRKKGGQPGHKGNTLEYSTKVDKTIQHLPADTVCQRCGTSLIKTNTYIKARKQVHDIPPVKISVTEHQKLACDCPNCGRSHQGQFPASLKGNVQYGPNLHAIVTYLSVYQYIPVYRLSCLLSDVLGTKISQSTVINILQDMGTKAESTVYQDIKQEVARSNCVGGDETGIKIAGKRGWFFVFQTSSASFILSSLNRDFATIERAFEHGFVNAIYVSDCLAAQLKVNAKAHQLCFAHLLRETENFIQSLKCKWSELVQTFFYLMLSEKNKLKEQNLTISDERYAKIKQIFQQTLLDKVPKDSHEKVLAFSQRLSKHIDSIFQFLLYDFVPPDNNGSERAIRNAKVKIKISGFFASIEGAQHYAVLRSVIDTCLKKGLNLLDSLSKIAMFPSPIKTAE